MADRIFIVRHGQTEWSQSGRHTSHTDLPLTDAGRRSASQLAERLAGTRFGLVLCSPLRRARETCELAGFGRQAEECPDLHEWDYGRYEGLTTPEIHEQDPDWSLWRDGCPDGESPSDVGLRVDGVLERFGSIESTGLAFAHGHVLRALTARWLELDVSGGARFKLAAAGVGVLGHERDTQVLESWSV